MEAEIPEAGTQEAAAEPSEELNEAEEASAEQNEATEISGQQEPESSADTEEAARPEELEETEELEEIEETAEIPDEIVSDMLKSEDTVGDVLEKVAEVKKETKESKEQIKMAEQTTKLTGVATDENAVITAGMTITGNVISKGSIEVLGTINGDLETLGKLDVSGTIKGNSKAAEVFAENARITGEVRSDGTIKIGQSSVIIGNIFAKSAVIAGAVKGDIDVQGPVVLDTSAIVMGNIKSKSVQINNGAVIEGLCSQCYADVSPTAFFDEYKG
ncbi:MAG: polymer-forming cytoskeletal protein [Lachnospiraceae bacterium]|nr:polymer-forming cytoskeletal protein [Lachnospiraceae bacterium]